jgi:hypothetical protein
LSAAAAAERERAEKESGVLQRNLAWDMTSAAF